MIKKEKIKRKQKSSLNQADYINERIKTTKIPIRK